MSDAIPWPPQFIDADGNAHDWDDPVEAEDDEELEDDYTYREWAEDMADSQGLGIEEWLEVTGQLDEPQTRSRRGGS